jgi:aminomethyltransferase
MTAKLYITARLRKSPFFERTLEAGATTFSVYNKTYLPGGYSDPESEFRSLIDDVTLWDVTCQRIVQIAGPDALRFMDLLTPRSLSANKVGCCRYLLITGQDGGILNDPVMLRLEEDRFWLSSADSDLRMWAQGVAVHAGLDVEIDAPDVATLQLQGPKSVDVLRALTGERVCELPYYHFTEVEIGDISVILARTGWSAERGYEIYLRDTARGLELWDLLMETGRPYGIAPASPSRIRRIEAGILDYSVDMDERTNPFEVGLDRLVDLDKASEFIGKAALRRIKSQGARRKVAGIEIEGPPVQPNDRAWPVLREGRSVGRMTSWVYSPRLQRNIGFAMLELACTGLGTEITVHGDDGEHRARVVETPFVDPQRKLSKG